MSQQNKDNEVVEYGGPEGNRTRYQRYKKSIGKGAFKTVYEALDTEQGNLVAWNQVDRGNLDGKKYEEFRNEVLTLRKLDHRHIIRMTDWWDSEDESHVVFITELMTSGDLKKFIKQRSAKVNMRTTRKWARQILEALDYLHTNFDHPIVHRDIKCDNIFINGNLGEVKLGDLGLSTMMTQTHAASVLGTPEFMAPEMYGEIYNQKVDIYAFGMCILEILTGQYPYEECQNAGQIFMKVNKGIPPKALIQMENLAVKHFIESCLAPEDVRPTARQLLEHELLIDLQEVEACAVAGGIEAKVPAVPQPNQPVTTPALPQFDMPASAAPEKAGLVHTGSVSSDGTIGTVGAGGAGPAATAAEKSRTASEVAVLSPPIPMSGAGTGADGLRASDPHVSAALSAVETVGTQRRPIFILDTMMEAPAMDHSAQIIINAEIDGKQKKIQFEFNLEEDSSAEVAADLVEELLENQAKAGVPVTDHERNHFVQELKNHFTESIEKAIALYQPPANAPASPPPASPPPVQSLSGVEASVGGMSGMSGGGMVAADWAAVVASTGGVSGGRACTESAPVAGVAGVSASSAGLQTTGGEAGGEAGVGAQQTWVSQPTQTSGTSCSPQITATSCSPQITAATSTAIQQCPSSTGIEQPSSAASSSVSSSVSSSAVATPAQSVSPSSAALVETASSLDACAAGLDASALAEPTLDSCNTAGAAAQVSSTGTVGAVGAAAGTAGVAQALAYVGTPVPVTPVAAAAVPPQPSAPQAQEQTPLSWAAAAAGNASGSNGGGVHNGGGALQLQQPAAPSPALAVALLPAVVGVGGLAGGCVSSNGSAPTAVAGTIAATASLPPTAAPTLATVVLTRRVAPADGNQTPHNQTPHHTASAHSGAHDVPTTHAHCLEDLDAKLSAELSAALGKKQEDLDAALREYEQRKKKIEDDYAAEIQRLEQEHLRLKRAPATQAFPAQGAGAGAGTGAAMAQEVRLQDVEASDGMAHERGLHAGMGSFEDSAQGAALATTHAAKHAAPHAATAHAVTTHASTAHTAPPVATTHAAPPATQLLASPATPAVPPPAAAPQ